MIKGELINLAISSKIWLFHSGPENLKKCRPKKLIKSNKSISQKAFFNQVPFFAISKMAKNQFLKWEKF